LISTKTLKPNEEETLDRHESSKLPKNAAVCHMRAERSYE